MKKQIITTLLLSILLLATNKTYSQIDVATQLIGLAADGAKHIKILEQIKDVMDKNNVQLSNLNKIYGTIDDAQKLIKLVDKTNNVAKHVIYLKKGFDMKIKEMGLAKTYEEYLKYKGKKLPENRIRKKIMSSMTSFDYELVYTSLKQAMNFKSASITLDKRIDLIEKATITLKKIHDQEVNIQISQMEDFLEYINMRKEHQEAKDFIELTEDF